MTLRSRKYSAVQPEVGAVNGDNEDKPSLLENGIVLVIVMHSVSVWKHKEDREMNSKGNSESKVL